MPVHEVIGLKVEANFSDQNYFFARRQGVKVKVNPHRNWWCLWLCSSTNKVDRISVSGVLFGTVGTQDVNSSCSNCGSRGAYSNWFLGFSVPRAFDRVEYRVNIENDGQGGSFSGSDLA